MIFPYNFVMLSQKDIFNLYKKYNVSSSKRFGQNFLIDKNILNEIVNVTNIENKHVVEIGPGLGSLTNLLIKKARKVSSYEIDKDMIKVLKGEIHDSKFELIEGDFLKADLDWKEKRIILANIPYNITSDILFKLFINSHKISEAVLMMQKEVGERLIAKIGTRNYGKLTITTQLFADVEKIISVSPSAFIPSPKVTSIVIKLKFKDFKYDIKLLDFIKNCFAQRRKTLFNNLRNFIDNDLAKTIITNMNLKESIRPQELSKDQFIKIYNEIKSFNNY